MANFQVYPTNLANPGRIGTIRMTLNIIFVLIIITDARGFEYIKIFGGEGDLAAPYWRGGVLAVACHITATAPSEPCCHVVSSLLFFIHWLDQFMEPVAEYFPLSFLFCLEPELSICIHQTVPTLPLLPVVTPRRHGDSSHSDKHHNTSASTTNTPSTIL